MSFPNELAPAINYTHIKARRPMAYALRTPLVFRVEDGDFTAYTTDNLVVVCRQFFAVTMTDYVDQSFVIVHEIAHNMLRHPRKLKAWQQAGNVTGRLRNGTLVTYPFVMDYAQWALDCHVNDFNVRLGYKLPEGAILWQWAGGWMDIEEDIYVRICEKFDNGCPPPQPQPQTGNDVQPDGDAPERIDQEQARREALIEALSPGAGGWMPGMMPGDLTRLLDHVAPEPVKWWQIIRPRYIANFGHGHVDWTRGCKQAASLGYYLPRRVARTAGVLCWVVDTSGSITQDDVARFVMHNKQMATSCKPRQLIILAVDHDVQQSFVFDKWQDAVKLCDDLMARKVKLKGGGGTNMPAAHNWLREHKIHPDMTLFLTDGYTPWPSDLGTSKECYWLITNNHAKAPAAAGKTYVL